MKLSFLNYAIVFIFFNFYSCTSQTNRPDDKEVSKMSVELLEKIVHTEKLSQKAFSKTQYFHCKINSLNEDAHLFSVALNHHLPIQNVCAEITVGGIKTFIYYNCESSKTIQKSNKSNVDPFFVPDSYKSNFLIERFDNFNRIRGLSDYGLEIIDEGDR